MFRSFFLSKKWFWWATPGGILILAVTWYKVQLDVQINDWFGTFYDLVQKALTTPGSVTTEQIIATCFIFAKIAAIYVFVGVLIDFFTKHFVFRWRTAMNFYYMRHWDKLRNIEGAAQRIQEDTMRFAAIMETLAVAFMQSIMLLIAFLPILWTLSDKITSVLLFGALEHSLVYLAIISAAMGTVFLALVGIKLPGLQFKNQKVEAAYRKELVYGEDNEDRAQPPSVKELYANLRRNYFTLYMHYLYFDIARWSYLQFSVILPYLFLSPTIAAGTITFGLLQQVSRAFGKVENSFQYLVNSWPTIVELMSIYKRLKAFEENISKEARA